MAKTYNTFTNVSAGSVLTASGYNDVLENVGNYRVPPMVRCVLNADVNPYSNGSDIAWNGTDSWDTDAMHDTVTNNTRITFQTAGLYLVTLQIYVTHASTITLHECGIKDQSANIWGQTFMGGSAASGNAVVSCQAVVDSATVTYVTGYGSFTGATSLVLKADSQRRTFFSATWLGQVS